MRKILHVLLTAMLSGMVMAEPSEPCSGGPGGGSGGGGGSGQGSGDPNEMSGPIGVGNPDTERFVKPGEPLTYTVYFENVPTATAAAEASTGPTASSPIWHQPHPTSTSTTP